MVYIVAHDIGNQKKWSIQVHTHINKRSSLRGQQCLYAFMPLWEDSIGAHIDDKLVAVCVYEHLRKTHL